MKHRHSEFGRRYTHDHSGYEAAALAAHLYVRHGQPVTFDDVPVIDGVATLPDGRTVESTANVVRVPVLRDPTSRGDRG